MIGNLDDSALLQWESAAADIVLRECLEARSSFQIQLKMTIGDRHRRRIRPCRGCKSNCRGTGILTYEDSDKVSMETRATKCMKTGTGWRSLSTYPIMLFIKRWTSVFWMLLESMEMCSRLHWFVLQPSTEVPSRSHHYIIKPSHHFDRT